MNKQESHNTSHVINCYLKQSQQTFNTTKTFRYFDNTVYNSICDHCHVSQ